MTEKTNQTPENTTPAGGVDANAGGAAETSITSPKITQDEIAGIMDFDPFAPPKEPLKTPLETTPADGKTPEAKPGTTPPADGTPKPGAAEVKPATPAAQPDMAKLIKDQTEAIKALAAQPKPDAAPADQTEKPRYNLAIPPQVLDAMASEDPAERAGATHALINGVANLVYRDTITEVKQAIGQMIQNFPGVIESHLAARQAQQGVGQDFYGTYKSLQNPELLPLIQNTAMRVWQGRMQAGQSLEWSPEMRDAIAEEVFKIVPHLKPAAQPGNGVTPKARTFSTGGGARQGTPGGNTPENEMAAILGLTH